LRKHASRRNWQLTLETGFGGGGGVVGGVGVVDTGRIIVVDAMSPTDQLTSQWGRGSHNKKIWDEGERMHAFNEKRKKNGSASGKDRDNESNSRQVPVRRQDLRKRTLRGEKPILGPWDKRKGLKAGRTSVEGSRESKRRQPVIN